MEHDRARRGGPRIFLPRSIACMMRRRPDRADAVLNYLYGIRASGVGLDAGLGIFHTDAAPRASLTYDAMEAVRPRVEGWLADASFSKRDFYEESDGTIRITRVLTSRGAHV